ncbi:hypothetical protein NXU99_27900 [Parabacteroides goldsteinii]|nr:hypothetical protein [Parabacteroides goldsteinii]
MQTFLISSLTTANYETYHRNSTDAVSYSFCYGAGKELHFHLRQDENVCQVVGGTQRREDISEYSSRETKGMSIFWTVDTRPKVGKIINPASNTNLTVSLKNGKYSISGKFNGKPISKTVNSKRQTVVSEYSLQCGADLKKW